MGQYLDQFRGVIGQRQTEQILKLLNKKKNTGQIRSVKEFTEQLKQLMQELTATILQPSLKLFMGKENDFISSETYNFMLDRVQDDLEAAFEEANKIDEVQKSHEAIIRDVVLKNLRAGVSELESKITLYEFLNKDLRGFDTAIFSTFKELKEGRTQRTAGLTRILFVDPRTSAVVSSSEDATVELIGERLVLPEETILAHSVKSIRQIFDADTPQSELIVEPPGSDINNILDETIGTYWVQSLLFQERKSSVKVKLEFNFGVSQEINFIDIQPAIKNNIILEAVHYIDGNNVVVDLGLPEYTITAHTGIRIRKIATKRLILTFRNEHASQVQFEYDETSEHLVRQALEEPNEGYVANIQKVSNDLDKLISSANIKEIIGITSSEAQSFSGYEFLTGFDNINIGLATYKSRGIYLSAPLELDDMGELGLKTIESRPYMSATGSTIQFTNETYDNDTDNELTFSGNDATAGRFFYGSIEYWVIRQELGDNNVLLRTTIFPILPLGTQRIHQERLILAEKSSSSLLRNDIGQTMFFTNTTTNEGNLKVYCNGILMDDNSDDTEAVDGWKHYPANPPTGPHGDIEDRQPNNGSPMRFRIQIVDPLPGNIYTVSYNPLVSNTCAVPNTLSEYSNANGLKIVDMVGDLSARLESSKIIVIDRPGEELAIKKTRVYLMILLRQNTAETSLTPAVEEYTLVAGKKDKTKFEGD